jgi:hypothetical protein
MEDATNERQYCTANPFERSVATCRQIWPDGKLSKIVRDLRQRFHSLPGTMAGQDLPARAGRGGNLPIQPHLGAKFLFWDGHRGLLPRYPVGSGISEPRLTTEKNTTSQILALRRRSPHTEAFGLFTRGPKSRVVTAPQSSFASSAGPARQFKNPRERPMLLLSPCDIDSAGFHAFLPTLLPSLTESGHIDF